MNLNIKKNKKSITFSFIILLILGMIVFIISAVFVKNSIEDSQYYTDLNLCRDFFSNINGNDGYFKKIGIGDKPNEKLIRTIEKICPSKKIEVNSKNDLKRVSTLISNCHTEFNKGEDIFKGRHEENTICVYCGKVKIKDSLTLNNPGKTIISLLKKENKYDNLITSKTSINLNSNFIGNEEYLNEIFKDTNEVYLFYQIHSKYLPPDQSAIDILIRGLSQKYPNLLKFENKVIDAMVRKATEITNPPIYFIFGGKQEISNNNPKIINTYYSNKCDTIIIPDKEYD